MIKVEIYVPIDKEDKFILSAASGWFGGRETCGGFETYEEARQEAWKWNCEIWNSHYDFLITTREQTELSLRFFDNNKRANRTSLLREKNDGLEKIQAGT